MVDRKYDGVMAVLFATITLWVLQGCGSKELTPQEVLNITKQETELVKKENTELKARIQAIESLCKPFLAPEGLEATKNVQNASQAALLAQQQASNLTTQVQSLATQANTVKQQADALTQSLNTSATADRIKTLEGQISTIQQSIVQMQAFAIAIDNKVGKIKLDSSMIGFKTYCKCSQGK